VEFLTLVSTDYESALRQARTEYGKGVRVHTRKDFHTNSVFRKKSCCEITFYLVGEKTPQEVAPPKVFDSNRYLSQLLDQNDVPKEYLQRILDGFHGEEHPGKAEVEIFLLQQLFSSLQWENRLPGKFMVLVGPAGVGKTTSLVKTAIHLRAQEGKKVALLSFDVHRIGALEQIRQFAASFSLPLYEAGEVAQLRALLPDLEAYDHVLVDTSGRSVKDEDLRQRLDDLLSELPHQQVFTLLAVSASLKFSDLVNQYRLFGEERARALVVTKLDETQSIGNVLAFAQHTQLPLLYVTDGQAIPEDFHSAEASDLMQRLNGLSLDVSQFFPVL
jgi:flagellar biosynthesis protein FlhF